MPPVILMRTRVYDPSTGDTGLQETHTTSYEAAVSLQRPGTCRVRYRGRLSGRCREISKYQFTTVERLGVTTRRIALDAAQPHQRQEGLAAEPLPAVLRTEHVAQQRHLP